MPNLTYFARGWADSQQKIGIDQADRRFHFLTTGRTGTGKSSLLLNKVVQDFQSDLQNLNLSLRKTSTYYNLKDYTSKYFAYFLPFFTFFDLFLL